MYPSPNDADNNQFQQNLLNYQTKTTQFFGQEKSQHDQSYHNLVDTKDKPSDQETKNEIIDTSLELTDLGFYDSHNESSETMKQIIKNSLDKEVEQWIPTEGFNLGLEPLSPVTSSLGSRISTEQLGISSPTTSVFDQTEVELTTSLENLVVNQDKIPRE